MELDVASLWILIAAALVLLMTPALGLFYGGMTRATGVVNMMLMSFSAAAITAIVWVLWGYSVSAGEPAIAGIIGNPISDFALHATPESGLLAAGFAGTFAMISVAIISGAIADRSRFAPWLMFVPLWVTLVYAPVAFWVWGGGMLSADGFLGKIFGEAIDFAGGAVVHVNAGVAGLVCAIVLGPRHGWGRDNMAPHNLAFTAIGTGLLFVGWMGFNGGSAAGANEIAAVAVFNTLLAPAAAAVGWITVEWTLKKKPTLLGLLTGVVAGLVAITPAAGFVDPKGAFLIGLISGPIAYAGAVWLKHKLKYDDSLDAFGVHGVAGIAGALLTGVFANAAINPAAEGATVLKQAIGLGGAMVWSAAGTFMVLMICKYTVGLRVQTEAEIEGLDYSEHGEALP